MSGAWAGGTFGERGECVLAPNPNIMTLDGTNSWVLRELDLFKSKFRGAAATLLGAGDSRGFSLGTPLGGRWEGTRVAARGAWHWCGAAQRCWV